MAKVNRQFGEAVDTVNLPRKGYRVGLRIDIFEACSAFTHVAGCTLALSPIRDMHFPKASTVSLPPQLLR